jgi:hypothetical protein
LGVAAVLPPLNGLAMAARPRTAGLPPTKRTKRRDASGNNPSRKKSAVAAIKKR